MNTPDIATTEELAVLKRLARMIKAEADRRLGRDKALTRRAAYEEAQIFVIMQLAEEDALTQTESLVYESLCELQKSNGGKEVVRSSIRSRLDKLREQAAAKKKPFPEMSEMTINRTLNRLEDKGLVYRPRGPRTKGWSAVKIQQKAA